MKKILLAIVALLGLLFIFWYFFVALKPQTVEQSKIIASYQYTPKTNLNLKLQQVADRTYEFTYQSFDNETVYGKISYPAIKKEKYPVVLGVPAMGRSYIRWWQDSFKGRPTVTKVNELQKIADNKGMVVIAIDARFHGKRKKPQKSLQSIMYDLDLFGDKEPYQAMIVDTVKDYRVLLDWVNTQNDLDGSNVSVIGYSMGGQIALILGSIDDRVSKVISIVPPFIDDKIAIVSPKNLVDKLNNKMVILVSSDDDENASEEDNQYLFDLISAKDKQHIIFEGGHILPDDYPKKLEPFIY